MSTRKFKYPKKKRVAVWQYDSFVVLGLSEAGCKLPKAVQTAGGK